jgi:hypothetical protein
VPVIFDHEGVEHFMAELAAQPRGLGKATLFGIHPSGFFAQS